MVRVALIGERDEEVGPSFPLEVDLGEAGRIEGGLRLGIDPGDIDG